MSSSMDMLQPIVGSDYFLLDLGTERDTLSSAAIGGGLSRRRWIFSRSVERNWSHHDPLGDTLRYAQRVGVDPAATLGLITAVFADRVRLATATYDAWRVDVYATVGVGNATVAGACNPPPAYAAGTINVIALVYGRLAPEGMVGAVQTATEAKTRAVIEAGIRNEAGQQATGTSTDTVTVVNIQDEPASPFAGPAAPAGIALGQAVYAAVSAGLAA